MRQARNHYQMNYCCWFYQIRKSSWSTETFKPRNARGLLLKQQYFCCFLLDVYTLDISLSLLITQYIFLWKNYGYFQIYYYSFLVDVRYLHEHQKKKLFKKLHFISPPIHFKNLRKMHLWKSMERYWEQMTSLSPHKQWDVSKRFM